jgi:hypothetical protein
MPQTGELMFRRIQAAVLGPVCAQVIRHAKVLASDRKFPAGTGRSGTKQARRHGSQTSAATSGPWSSSPIQRPTHYEAGGSVQRRRCTVQARHIPSWRRSCGSYALSPVAAVSRWLLPLLSSLLSLPLRPRAPSSSTPSALFSFSGLDLLVLLRPCSPSVGWLSTLLSAGHARIAGIGFCRVARLHGVLPAG